MGTLLKCWSVAKTFPPREAILGAPELEGYLEDWIEDDIGLVDPSLLVIGRQVDNIDLLAMDEDGQLVVIEIKRDQLTRLALAQALDYVSLCAHWTPDKVISVANAYLARKSKRSIHEEFQARFDASLDSIEGLNMGQRLILVGCRVDATLERAVNWLSDQGVAANLVTLSFFTLPDGQNVLVQSVLVSEEEAKARSDAKRGRRTAMSLDEVSDLIAERGLQDDMAPLETLDALPALFKVGGLDGFDYEVHLSRSGAQPLRRKAIQVLVRQSVPGRIRIRVLFANIAQFLHADTEQVLGGLAKLKWDPNVSWSRETDLTSGEEATRLCDSIAQMLRSAG